MDFFCINVRPVNAKKFQNPDSQIACEHLRFRILARSQIANFPKCHSQLARKHQKSPKSQTQFDFFRFTNQNRNSIVLIK